MEELERTVALLAFEDVSNSPVGDLLDISQRLKTASEVNAAILTSQSHEKGLYFMHKSVLGHVFDLRNSLRIQFLVCQILVTSATCVTYPYCDNILVMKISLPNRPGANCYITNFGR